MSDLNDKRYKELLKSIVDGDDEKLSFMLRPKDVYGVRDELENSLGRFVKDNYNNKPSNLNELFAKQFNMPPVAVDPSIKGNVGEYIYHPKQADMDKIALAPGLHEAESMGTILHELGHKKDIVSGYDSPELNKIVSAKDIRNLSGLENAEKYFEGHHQNKPLFGLEAIRDLIKSGKIRSMAGMAGAGLGGALGLLGMSEKAQAGDYPGAALSAATVVDPTGLAGAANEIRERLNDKDYAVSAAKSDRINAMPLGLDIEQQAIQDNDDAKLEALKQIKSR